MLAVNLCVMYFRHLFVLEMRGEDISDFVKGQMYALRRYAQWSYRQIANVLHINYQTIARISSRKFGSLVEKVIVKLSEKLHVDLIVLLSVFLPQILIIQLLVYTRSWYL